MYIMIDLLRTQVHWKADSTWYSGKIVSYKPTKIREFHIKYRDGDNEYVRFDSSLSRVWATTSRKDNAEDEEEHVIRWPKGKPQIMSDTTMQSQERVQAVPESITDQAVEDGADLQPDKLKLKPSSSEPSSSAEAPSEKRKRGRPRKNDPQQGPASKEAGVVEASIAAASARALPPKMIQQQQSLSKPGRPVAPLSQQTQGLPRSRPDPPAEGLRSSEKTDFACTLGSSSTEKNPVLKVSASQLGTQQPFKPPSQSPVSASGTALRAGTTGSTGGRPVGAPSGTGMMRQPAKTPQPTQASPSLGPTVSAERKLPKAATAGGSLGGQSRAAVDALGVSVRGDKGPTPCPPLPAVGPTPGTPPADLDIEASPPPLQEGHAAGANTLSYDLSLHQKLAASGLSAAADTSTVPPVGLRKVRLPIDPIIL